jgi:hypothetical protein
MSVYLSGSFHDERGADEAIERLIVLGYAREKVDVMMSQETRRRYGLRELPGSAQGANVSHGKEPGGEVLGAAFGAIVAGTAALTVFGSVITGGLAVPFVAGPLAALVAGGGGAVVGGFLGALLGTGMPEKQAKRIEHDIDAGAIVVGIEADHDDAGTIGLILAGDSTTE